MVDFYYKLVKYKKLSIDKVPDKWRKAVLLELEKRHDIG